MRRSFRDPITGILKAHGLVDRNEPNDVGQSESDEFDLTPGRWRWDGQAWVPLGIVLPSDTQIGREIDQDVNLKATALFLTDQLNAIRARPGVGLPQVDPETVVAGVIEKRKTLPSPKTRVAKEIQVLFGTPTTAS